MIFLLLKESSLRGLILKSNHWTDEEGFPATLLLFKQHELRNFQLRTLYFYFIGLNYNLIYKKSVVHLISANGSYKNVGFKKILLTNSTHLCFFQPVGLYQKIVTLKTYPCRFWPDGFDFVMFYIFWISVQKGMMVV